jgi:hypothetical protein
MCSAKLEVEYMKNGDDKNLGNILKYAAFDVVSRT